MIGPRQLSNSAVTAQWPEMLPAEALDAPEPEAGQGGMSVAQVLSIVRAQWKPMLIISLVAIGLTALVVKRMPKTYEAVATLIVNTQSRDPLAAQAVTADFNYITTQMELMLSPVILLPVVDRLDLTHDKGFTRGF